MDRDSAWLADILMLAQEAIDHVGDMDREQFLADLKTQRAVELLIALIGEVAGQLSQTAREQLSVIPWRQIVSMRNRLIHH